MDQGRLCASAYVLQHPIYLLVFFTADDCSIEKKISQGEKFINTNIFSNSLPKWCYHIWQQLRRNQVAVKALMTRVKTSVLRSHWKDTFNFLCSTSQFKAVFPEDEVEPQTQFVSPSGKIGATQLAYICQPEPTSASFECCWGLHKALIL